MGDAMMKMLVAITLRHFDIEPENGPGTFVFPEENPRSTGLNRAVEKGRVVLKARSEHKQSDDVPAFVE